MEEITNIVNRLLSDGAEESRRKLIDGLRDLSYTIEDPHDTLQRIMFTVRTRSLVKKHRREREINLLSTYKLQRCALEST